MEIDLNTLPGLDDLEKALDKNQKAIEAAFEKHVDENSEIAVPETDPLVIEVAIKASRNLIYKSTLH